MTDLFGFDFYKWWINNPFGTRQEYYAQLTNTPIEYWYIGTAILIIVAAGIGIYLGKRSKNNIK